MKTMIPDDPFDYDREADLYRQQYRAMMGNARDVLRQVQSAPVVAIRAALRLT